MTRPLPWYPRLQPWLIAACLIGSVLLIVFSD